MSIYTLDTEPSLAGGLADDDEFAVYDASTKRIKSATGADLRNFAGGGALETLTADTTLTAADHGGKTLLLGEVGGNASLTATLPAASGSGVRFRFVVSVVNTSNYVIQVANATDVMQGNIITVSTGDTPDLAAPWLAGATDDTITLNATTTGGVSIGDWIEVQDILSGFWAVTGLATATGTEATPFSAAVS